MQLLINKIKAKHELKDISNQFIKEQIELYLKRNPKQKKFLERPKSTGYKKIVKEIRASLRRSTGLFSVGKTKNTLETHSSTKERLSFYSKLYQKIFKITNKPKTILDLGCGLNPLSIPYMKLKNFSYYAYDINRHDVKIVKEFFKKNKIKGKAEVKDVLKVKSYPNTDLTFLFKMTDVLDRGKGHKTTEKLIKKIPTKFIIVSFPTITMSGKPMNFPRRKWIELMCNRLKYKFKILKFSNEIFYVLKK